MSSSNTSLPQQAGQSTAGDLGTAIAGNCGKAMAGYKGTATAGEKGKLCIQYWDKTAECYRTAIANIGENGIKPNVAYKLDDKHGFVEASR